jgi:hypothetical protein
VFSLSGDQRNVLGKEADCSKLAFNWQRAIITHLTSFELVPAITSKSKWAESTLVCAVDLELLLICKSTNVRRSLHLLYKFFDFTLVTTIFDRNQLLSSPVHKQKTWHVLTIRGRECEILTVSHEHYRLLVFIWSFLFTISLIFLLSLIIALLTMFFSFEKIQTEKKNHE